MFIPVGLIVRLAAGAAREAAMESDMRAAAYAHEMSTRNTNARELWAACTGELASLVVLGENVWDECWIDGVQVHVHATDGAMSGYRDAHDVLGPGPHGLLGVAPGRHTVATRVGDRWASTAFVLFPREALCLRLDPVACVYDTYDKPRSEAILARLGTDALKLVHYSTSVAGPLIQGFRARGAREALGQAQINVKHMIGAATKGEEGRAIGCAREAADALYAAPITSFEPLTSAIGFAAFELMGKNKNTEARIVLRAGLMILPEDPTLLAALGELAMREGDTTLGRDVLTRALARDAGLDERMKARALELVGT